MIHRSYPQWCVVIVLIVLLFLGKASGEQMAFGPFSFTQMVTQNNSNITIHKKIANLQVVLTGVITSSATGKPIPNVNIQVSNQNTGTVSGKDGDYRLTLMRDSSRVVFKHVGFSPVEKVIVFHMFEDTVQLDIELTPSTIPLPGVTISADSEVPKIARYEIVEAQMRKIPNPLPDAMMSIKTLPGVFSGNDQSSFYHVRGGSYDDNLIRLNGVEIFQPLIVRKGIAENPSVVNPWLVQSINLQTGAYPVFYGDKLSSVLDISYRDGSKSPLQAMAGLSTVKAEAALEGPIGKIGSFVAAARKIDYSYIWKDLQTDGTFNPDFKDVQAMVTVRPTINQQVSLFGVYNQSVYQANPRGYAPYYSKLLERSVYTSHMDGEEKFQSSVAVFSLNWRYRPANWLEIRIQGASFRQEEHEQTDLAHTFDIVNIDSMYTHSGEYNPEKGDRHEEIDNELHVHSTRYLTELFMHFRAHQFRLGLEQRQVTFDDRINESIEGSYLFPTDPGEPIKIAALYETMGRSAFFQHTWRWKKLNIQSGLRYSRFNINDEVLWMPRFRLSVAIKAETDLSLAAGYYAQPPLYKEVRNTVPGFRSGVLAQKSRQITMGVQHHWGERRSSLKLEAFYKQMSDLISHDVSDVRTVYSGINDSRGYAYGFDAHLRGMITPDCISWVSYSYLVARENLIGDEQGWVPRPSDQRHILSLKLEDKMVRFPGSRIHVRVLYGSGSRYTNYWGSRDDDGVFDLHTGSRNSMTMPAYKRFDVGLTQDLTFGNVNIFLREEVLNLFNRQNVMGYAWKQGEKSELYLGGRTYMIGAQIVIGG